MNIEALLCEKGEITYANFLVSIKEKTAKVLIADEDGVLVSVSDATSMVALFNDEAYLRFANELVGLPSPIAVHDGKLVGYLLEQGMKRSLSCIQAVYPGTERFALNDEVVIRPLVMGDLEIVLANYHHLADEPYIRERLAKGVMIGAEVGGQLAGFMGRHSEGAMGMLEILPAFRRRSLGSELEKAYINRLLDASLIPYCHVVHTNEASLRLQKKLGLVFSEEMVHWFN
ncbi:GNAT family N-acetyltransferase [Sphaerochaeta sp.]|uniref:GNAT family N-acetyltransferase n=1 Tax=Sphaerochaeta sp. TaxID=1972642 RepID=UPI003D144A86